MSVPAESSVVDHLHVVTACPSRTELSSPIYLSLEDIRGFPKKKKEGTTRKGRRRGKTMIATDTPEKEEIANRKRLKKQPRAKRKALKKLFKDEIEDSDEDGVQLEYKESSDENNFSEPEPEQELFGNLHYDPEPDNFVLVEFKEKGSSSSWSTPGILCLPYPPPTGPSPVLGISLPSSPNTQQRRASPNQPPGEAPYWSWCSAYFLAITLPFSPFLPPLSLAIAAYASTSNILSNIIQIFEKFIEKNTLVEFKKEINSDKRVGPESDTSLFHVWRKMQNLVINNSTPSLDPTISSQLDFNGIDMDILIDLNAIDNIDITDNQSISGIINGYTAIQHYQVQCNRSPQETSITSPQETNITSPQETTLYVTFHGSAHVSWKKSYGVGKNRRTVHYSGEEVYFNYKIYLVMDSNNETILPMGDLSYPFSFTVPLNLPSSFETSKGSIRYTVKATLDRPWKFNQDVKEAISIMPLTDLNLIPQLREVYPHLFGGKVENNFGKTTFSTANRDSNLDLIAIASLIYCKSSALNHAATKEPAMKERMKRYCCLCCASPTLSLIMRIPFTGFAPGQDITVSVNLENPTNVAINSVTCTLNQLCTLTATNPRKSTRVKNRQLNTITLGEVAKHSKASWEKPLKIPACPPTLQANCNVIKWEYNLQVMAISAGCHSNVEVVIPITIGTVPLIWGPPASFGTSPAAFGQPSIPSAPLLPPAGPSIAQLYPHSAPPPSYDECMFGAANIKDESDTDYTFGKMEFAPKYPNYKM
uniref:Arrestin C-terminal-like domain-containing protein n=1 Tax=Timema monikensis TaxID=170555 RepID=A0A7R9E0G0_9NEOP|nr:unnamed protein product [Timema monikensis]